MNMKVIGRILIINNMYGCLIYVVYDVLIVIYFLFKEIINIGNFDCYEVLLWVFR